MFRSAILILLFGGVFLCAQSRKHEVRAVWISTASGDWPTSTDPEEQRRSLIAMFDLLHKNNFNTIFFQVRPRGNVLYRSAIEPWATSLTGVLGNDPGYDPLAFAIDQAHQRGLELHAWFNVAKVWGSEQLPQNPRHVTRARRSWVRLFENEWWIDMGIPEARAYTEELVRELVSAYDIDGIHFDFIRYPSPAFDDWQSFSEYSDGVERYEWRRNNITSFVRNCYENIQKIKPWVKVGSAPLGIYQSIAGAQSSFNGYSGVFQDSRRWLREGIHDYLAPQIYWSLGEQKDPNDPDFEALSIDWSREQYGRHVYVGLGVYRSNIQEEVALQVERTRSAGAAGQAFFRYEHTAQIFDRLGGVYRHRTLVPPMVWKDTVPPNAPSKIVTERENGRVRLRWSAPPPAADSEQVFRYILYRSSNAPVDTRKGEHIIAVLPGDRLSFVEEHASAGEYFYTVTSIDRAGNESGVHVSTPSEIQTLLSRYRTPKAPVTLSSLTVPPGSAVGFVSFDLPQRSPVVFSVKYSGRVSDTVLVQGVKEAGVHIVAIDLAGSERGSIEYTVRTGERSITKRYDLP